MIIFSWLTQLQIGWFTHDSYRMNEPVWHQCENLKTSHNQTNIMKPNVILSSHTHTSLDDMHSTLITWPSPSVHYSVMMWDLKILVCCFTCTDYMTTHTSTALHFPACLVFPAITWSITMDQLSVIVSSSSVYLACRQLFVLCVVSSVECVTH